MIAVVNFTTVIGGRVGARNHGTFVGLGPGRPLRFKTLVLDKAPEMIATVILHITMAM